MEWRNIGYDVYREIMGDKLFKQKIEEFEKPLPPPRFLDGTKITLQTTKFKLLFGLKAFLKGQRATHPVGVGAQGIATIVSNPQFPACEFFTPGRSFAVCLRHSTTQGIDDVLIDLCGGPVKFAGSDDATSPCDIVLGTGPATALWNAEALQQGVHARFSGDIKGYLLMSPDHLAANIGGLRQKPDSFYDQRYYSEVILDFKAFDGVKRYVRFRLIPADGSPETGLLSEEVQRHPWINERSPQETLPEDYLKREYKERLRKGPLRYKLQLQLHEAKSDDSPLILHIGREWDEKTHPWLDLADIKTTSLLSPAAVERLEFNFKNLPASLDLLPAQSADDPNVIAHMRRDIYTWTQMLRAWRRKVVLSDHVATYVIRVETGNKSVTSNAPSISVALTGTKGKTDLISLDCHRTSKGEKTDKYSFEAMDVGEVLMINLHSDACSWFFKNPDWFVNRISVISSTEKDSFEFPCHQWVFPDVAVIQRGAFTPFEDQSEVTRAQRILELQKSQDLYKWGSLQEDEDLPGLFDTSDTTNVPQETKAIEDLKDQFAKIKMEAAEFVGLSSLLTSEENCCNFDDFKRISAYLPDGIPKIVDDERWMDDAMFGWQFLNGCNPNSVRRCEVLPENFPVMETMVTGFLDRGKSLGNEMKEGHVYIVDYKKLEGITDTAVDSAFSHTAQPLGLFYVKSSGDLVPIAIQLFQQPSNTNPIWTPSDSKYDWLLAKMWLRCADYQVQQANTNLLKLQMEAFAVAMRRQLPSIHPIFQLLFPHLSSTIAANTIRRENLIYQKGHLKLIKKTYKAFKFRMMSVPETLKERGLDDAEKLPNFYYRDDALRLWKAVTTFIQKVISVYYKSDDDVSKDIELQAWVQDMHDNGFPVRESGIDHEFPTSLATRDKLLDVLTCVVFTCSCQHAAMTFGLLEVAGFVPNSPFLMRHPPPTKKEETTLKSIMETLPNKSQAASDIIKMIVRTRFPENERFLGDYSQTIFERDEVKGAISDFQTDLHKITYSIKARNAPSLNAPYVNLLPERIPASIGI